MNPDLVQHLIEFLRREKPTLRELPIPVYAVRFLEEIDNAGFSIRKKRAAFVPKPDTKERYIAKVEKWQANFDFESYKKVFPTRDIHGELEKAALWLKNKSEIGVYKKEFNLFFQNWLNRDSAKPAFYNKAVQNIPQFIPANEREAIIAQGLRDLAASRSERVYPSEFQIRFGVACRDLANIPTEHLPEAFRRARATEMKGTPGIYHVQTAWKAFKAEKNAELEAQAKQRLDAEKQAEKERRESMSPEEREAEAESIRRSLEAAQQRHV